MTTRRTPGRLTSVIPAAAKMLSAPTWISSHVTSPASVRMGYASSARAPRDLA